MWRLLLENLCGIEGHLHQFDIATGAWIQKYLSKHVYISCFDTDIMLLLECEYCCCNFTRKLGVVGVAHFLAEQIL